MSLKNICGWDLGGAHVKVVSVDEHGRVLRAIESPCPLWRGIEHLREVVLEILATNDLRAASHVVSMTGELCDNFVSRDEGVAAILEVVETILGAERVRVFERGGRLLSLERARESEPTTIASANWAAMARVTAKSYANTLLIDIGSTTTDVLPIAEHTLQCRGFDDAARLRCDELIYTGVVRTPLMSLCSRAPYRGQWQRVAAEHFATTADVYRVLELLPATADLHDSADGADKSVTSSARRIARMIGEDFDGEIEPVRELARYFADRQFALLQDAIAGVNSALVRRPTLIVAAGVGEFLVQRLARFNELRLVFFADLFEREGVSREQLSTCAPAAALARLGTAPQ